MTCIIKPLITEKMGKLTEKQNKFGFVVLPGADKAQIASEVERLYGVDVVCVNTMRYAGKTKTRYTRSGGVRGRTNAYKKAIIALKEGQTIDFYSNI